MKDRGEMETKKTKTKTVAEFAKTYQPFIKACKLAGIEPSKNEASRFKRGIGTAIKFSNEQWRVDSHKSKMKKDKIAYKKFIKKGLKK